MKIFSSIVDLRSELNLVKSTGKTVGLVPTMGALHEGHISLVKSSLGTCDVTVATIFVNPTQFNNLDDLDKYPRNTDKDTAMLEEVGCDIAFIPSEKEMYPVPPELNIDFGQIEVALEGEHRPGHFRGVGLVVSKLFNIVQPTHAFFGQKDLQQFYVIKKLVDELSFQVKLIRSPIVREANGLAMSSRNERLSPMQRQEAGLIHQVLVNAKGQLKAGVSSEEVKAEVDRLLGENVHLELEYFEIVETNGFSSISEMTSSNEIALCIAVNVGDVRLIDNILTDR